MLLSHGVSRSVHFTVIFNHSKTFSKKYIHHVLVLTQLSDLSYRLIMTSHNYSCSLYSSVWQLSRFFLKSRNSKVELSVGWEKIPYHPTRKEARTLKSLRRVYIHLKKRSHVKKCDMIGGPALLWHVLLCCLTL